MAPTTILPTTSPSHSELGDSEDNATARLILQVLVEDLEKFIHSNRRREKRQEGDIDDFDVALRYYKDELEEASKAVSLNSTATRDANPPRNSGIWLAIAQPDWKLPIEVDRQAQVALQDVARGPTSTVNQIEANQEVRQPASHTDRSSSTTRSDLSRGQTEDRTSDVEVPRSPPPEIPERIADPQIESSEATAAEKEDTLPKFECGVCFDTFQLPSCIRIRQLSCGHWYCNDCLLDLFTRSLTDASLFPPRCCNRFIVAITHSDLDEAFPITEDLYNQLTERQLELGTPNRTYCHRSDCSTFIRPAFIHGDIGKCVKCSQRTCTICKEKAHKRSCPTQAARQQTIELALREGWRQCYACNRFVELKFGCNHICEPSCLFIHTTLIQPA